MNIHIIYNHNIMIASNQSELSANSEGSVFLQCASGLRPATSICVQANCANFALMCDEEECQCQHTHEGHSFQKVKAFLKKVVGAPDRLEELKRAEKVIASLIDSLE